MKSLSWRGPLAGLVALAVATGGWPSVGLADDDPDLQIEYVGPGPNPRIHVFKVTNIGDDDADPTTARVETIARGPANPLTIPIPRLRKNGGSYLFTYPLAAECDLTVVQARVNPRDDENEDNDMVEVAVCDVKPPPRPPGTAPVLKDLMAQGLTVHAERPNGLDDCGPGDNRVSVSAGLVPPRETERIDILPIAPFAVRLLVDGQERGVQTVTDIGPTRLARIVIFDKVELATGPHKLRVIVDANGVIDEPSEANNALDLDVTCAGEG